MKELGYINERLYTDVKSYHVFQDEETGKFYAFHTEKKIDLKNCPFERGGFCGHFYGTHEAFQDAKPFDVGEMFEITKRGENFYTTSPKVSGYARIDVDDVAEYTKDFEEGFYSVNIDGPWAYVRTFEKTPTGRVKKVSHKLGALEKTCRYYFDFNF